MKRLLGILAVLAVLALPAHAQTIVDFSRTTTHHLKFTTRSFTTGVPTTLAGSPVIKAYADGSTSTEVTTGLTLTVDFDNVTGLNDIAIDTSNAFYANGSLFSIIITTGTVGGTSVVGEVVAQFSVGMTVALTSQASDNLVAFFDNSSAASTARVRDVLSAIAVPRATSFEWGMSFVSNSDHFTPMNTGTPACTRTIDAPWAVGSTATTNQPAAVNSAGNTELTISTTDTAGSHYLWIHCTLTNADPYDQEFKLQTP